MLLSDLREIERRPDGQAVEEQVVRLPGPAELAEDLAALEDRGCAGAGDAEVAQHQLAEIRRKDPQAIVQLRRCERPEELRFQLVLARELVRREILRFKICRCRV